MNRPDVITIYTVQTQHLYFSYELFFCSKPKPALPAVS